MTENGSPLFVGWKEIAWYLGIRVATARSYKQDGSHILRFRGRVKAFKTELERSSVDKMDDGSYCV